jgi:hypothetical protein
MTVIATSDGYDQRKVFSLRRPRALHQIKADEDHVLILDLGPADKIDPRVESLGKSFAKVKREALVV